MLGIETVYSDQIFGLRNSILPVLIRLRASVDAAEFDDSPPIAWKSDAPSLARIGQPFGEPISPHLASFVAL